MADSAATPPDKKRQQPPPIEFLKPGEEQPAPPPQERPAAAWVTRPEDYQRPMYPQAPAPPRTAVAGPGNTARLAGILLILGAAVSVTSFLLTSLTPMSPADYANFTSDPTVFALNQVCALVVIWAQALMALGGIMAFLRMNWRMTVGVAFFSMLMLGGFALAVLDPVLLSAAFLGIVGFVLSVMAKKEFVS